jgi:lipopolysaccharide transport system permease protein
MKTDWTEIIEPKKNIFSINLKEIWKNKDLVYMYVKRDIVTMYKQTILGPLWFLINPLLTTFVFVFVFGNIAKISTDNLPQPLFYLSGIILWNYFSDTLTRNSQTFITNSNIFGKVYFPRIVVPLSIVISNLLKLLIQFGLFILILIYYLFQNYAITPNIYMLLFPLNIFMLAGLGLGFGILFSSLTTKYRDLVYLLTFGITLWQYATPIIYPLSSIPNDKKWIVMLNPLTAIIESFKFGFLGVGTFNINNYLYSFSFTIVLVIISLIIFNKVQRSFMDVI